MVESIQNSTNRAMNEAGNQNETTRFVKRSCVEYASIVQSKGFDARLDTKCCRHNVYGREFFSSDFITDIQSLHNTIPF